MARRRDRNSLINPEIAIYLLSSFNEWGGRGKRLLPNIKMLGLQCYFPSTPSLALLFVSPSLKSLDFFVLDSPSKVLRSVRKVLISLNAMQDVIQIHDFTIHYDETQERRAEFERTLIDFLCSQPTISTFAFGVLRSGTPLAKILQAVPRVKVLALAGPFSASEEELKAEIQIVADNAKDLQDFNYFGVREDSTAGSVLFSIPTPLFSCPNLRVLVLGCIDPACINGSLIENMGKSWPRMQSLELLPDAGLQYDRGVVPEDLIHFAAAFPSTLRNLAIPFTLSDLISVPIPQRSSRFLQLETLGVGLSVITTPNVCAFAELLQALAIRRVSINHSHKAGTEQGESWEQVNRVLKLEHPSTTILEGPA